MGKKSQVVLCLAALLAAGGAALWLSGPRWASAPAGQAPSAPRQAPASGVVVTAMNSHQVAESYSENGDIVSRPADPVLAEALSLESRMDFSLRLKAVHAFYGMTVSAEQATFMRDFVADSAIPEELNIRQVRALKNDVLNVLCAQPGDLAATAAMLRTLHADERADPGLRDYALQHLATLSEREPSLGWTGHWRAAEGADANLGATALLHLAGLHRSGKLTMAERDRLAAVALRIANDTTAKEPARATALQVCGQLGVGEARPLAAELARSDRAGMPLRIAAVATLGDLGGDESARAYLTTLATGPEKRLRVPAESALKRFSKN